MDLRNQRVDNSASKKVNGRIPLVRQSPDPAGQNPSVDIFLQRTNCRESNDRSNSEASQCSNIGSVGHLMRCKLVVQAMPCEECHVGAIVRQDLIGEAGAPRE